MFRQNINFYIIAVILLVIATGVHAGPNFITSPQKEATAGQFWSDADLFMSPGRYSALEFNKIFSVVSFYGNHADFGNNSMAQLGAATKFGNLYTAFYYGGNALNIAPHIYTETQNPFFGSKTIRSYQIEPGDDFDGFNPRNEIAVLFGFADMGFRVSFVSTYQVRNLNEDIVVRMSEYYKSFQNEYGSLNPEIAWGMTKDLTPIGIKPHVYLDVDFFRDYKKYEEYSGSSPADGTYGEFVERSNNMINLGLTAAMGAINLVKNDSFTLGLDLWYSLRMSLFDNEYSYLEDSKFKIGNIKGVYDFFDDVLEERSEIRHSVTPYLFAFLPGERISFSAELGLGLGFGSFISTEVGILAGSSGASLEKNGLDISTSWIGFNPTLKLGMQWAIVPQKFFLNAGSHISFGSFTLGTIETSSYVNGAKDSDVPDTKEIVSLFNGASTSLNIGVTFNPSINLSLQAMCGVDAGTNDISIFDTGGLAAFSKILVSLKF